MGYSLGPRPFPRMRKNLKGEEEMEGKGAHLGLA